MHSYVRMFDAFARTLYYTYSCESIKYALKRRPTCVASSERACFYVISAAFCSTHEIKATKFFIDSNRSLAIFAIQFWRCLLCRCSFTSPFSYLHTVHSWSSVAASLSLEPRDVFSIYLWLGPDDDYPMFLLNCNRECNLMCFVVVHMMAVVVACMCVYSAMRPMRISYLWNRHILVDTHLLFLIISNEIK